MIKALYTSYQFRLIHEKSSTGKPYNILFLPGGPGLGSEYYQDFIYSLTLPGTQWRVDFPGDGSNTLAKRIDYRQHWTQGFIQLLQCLDNIILVAHSFAGMFALGIPELEQHLSGLILIGSAPDKSWVNNMAEQKKKYNLPSATTERKHYHHNPSNENFKALTLALSPYFFCPASQDAGLKILQKLPYNHLPYDWSIQAFHAGYHLQWVPQTIPTLILSGEHDVLTPLTCFTQHPLFQRDNIKCVEIANSGHFPWVENQNDVAQHIKNFIDRIKY